MSVMLGTVVWTLGLRVTQRSPRPSRRALELRGIRIGAAASAPRNRAARHDLHGDDALARLGRLFDDARSSPAPW